MRIFYHKAVLVSLLFFSFLTSCQNSISKCNPNLEIIIKEYDYSDIKRDWLEMDLEFINQLVNLIESEPEEIISLIRIKDNRDRIILGNNYYMVKGSVGKGYVAVFYELIFKNKNLVSYRLKIKKEDFMLLEKNNIKLKKTFTTYNSSKGLYYYYYGLNKFDNISKKNINEKYSIDKDKFFYMTPYSGIIYGCRGGYGNLILENRCNFKRIENKLKAEDIILFMSSINPATRLTAIEYFFKNESLFSSKQKEIIIPLIQKIYKEYPKTRMLNNDILTIGSSKEMVEKQLKIECN